MRRLLTTSGVAALAAALSIVWGAAAGPAGEPNKPAAESNQPSSNLDFWLHHAAESNAKSDAHKSGLTATRPAGDANEGRNPFDTKGNFSREDAMPGAALLSDGQLMAGWVYTTRDHDLRVWQEASKRWVQVPMVTVLSITAVVGEEKMEPEWRWEGMGVPTKVFTGKEFPTRELTWTLHLIDDSTITGPIKGQPIWIENDDNKYGPFVLNETTKGDLGQKLKDLIYIQKIVISRHLMKQVLYEPNPAQAAATRPVHHADANKAH
jgi:hypothetical protein